MFVNKIDEDGVLIPMENGGIHFELIGEDDNYLIAMVIGDEKEGLVVTLDARDYNNFRHSLMVARHNLVAKIKQDNKIKELSKVLDKEFEE